MNPCHCYAPSTLLILSLCWLTTCETGENWPATDTAVVFISINCVNGVNLCFQSRLVTAIQVIVGGHVFAGGLATYFGNETWYEKYLMPAILRLTDPETGHRLAVKAARCGLMPRVKPASHPELVGIVFLAVLNVLYVHH